MRLFFSGGENAEMSRLILKGGGTDIMLSYYYLKKKRMKSFKLFEEHEPGDVGYFIDSGAHTIKYDNISGSDSFDDQYNFYAKYCEEYLEWVLKNKKYIDFIAELDIEKSTSVDLVYKLQQKFFIPFEKETGIPVCYVWHKERGRKEWANMCKRHSFVGVSSEHADSQYRPMVQTATKFGAKVHGFALTAPELMLKAGFYSVDSTRYLKGAKYGDFMVFTRNHLYEVRGKDSDSKKRLRNYFIKHDIDYKKLLDKSGTELTRANIVAMVALNDYVNKRTKDKQWWNDPNALKTIKDVPAPESIMAKQKTSKKKTKRDIIKDAIAQSKNTPGAESESPVPSTSSGAIKSPLQAPNSQLHPSTHIPDKSSVEPTTAPGTAPITPISQDTASDRPNLASEDSPEHGPDTNEKAISTRKADGRANNGAIIDPADHRKMMDAQKVDFVDTSLVCDTCYATDTCPKSKPGSVCTLINTFAKYEATNALECVNKIKSVIAQMEQRAHRQMYFEQLDGGYAGKDVTELMNQLIAHQELLAKLYRDMLPREGKVTIEGNSVLAAIFGPSVGAIDVKAEKEPMSPDAPDKEEPSAESDVPQSTLDRLKKKTGGSQLSDAVRKILKDG